MVYLNNDEINDLANKVIQRYREYIGVEWNLFKVEPIKLAEMLDLDVRFIDFGDDSEILGFTVFNECKKVSRIKLSFRLSNPMNISRFNLYYR